MNLTSHAAPALNGWLAHFLQRGWGWRGMRAFIIRL